MLRGLLAAFVALVLVWLIGGWFVVVHPDTDRPTRADAVVVLGSVHVDGRLELGLQLVDEGLAPNLVLSVSAPDLPAMDTYACNRSTAAVTVTCFVPNPGTTRGEAEELRRLAQQHNWKTIIVVTSTYHVSRARYIFGRCFSGRIEMVAADRGIGPATWAYQYLYQSAGYVKAFLESGC